jgi:hypothetical protein
MKIKTVTKGKNAGEVVELSASEKVPLALQDALAEHKDYKGTYLAYVRDVRVGNLNYSAKGSPLNGKWQNNVYRVEGSASFTFRDVVKNYLLHPKHMKFELQFEDCLDNLGQPDLKITLLDLRND